MQEKVVDLVGKNQLLDAHSALPQSRNQVHSLGEIHVSVVIAVNEQHRRFPLVHRRNRGGVVGQLGQFRRNILAIPVVGRPVVHAVKIDSGGENVGVARQAEGGEIAPITAAPQTDPRGVDIRPALQIPSGGHYVLIFAAAAAGAGASFAEGASVA